MINLAEVIDINSGKITTIDEPMGLGRAGHTATLLNNGKVFISGGFAWTLKTSETGQVLTDDTGNPYKELNPTPNLEMFDPETESFQKISDKLSEARGNHSALKMYDGRILLIGGETKGLLISNIDDNFKTASNTIDIFDPGTNSLYKVATLNSSRYRFTANLLTPKTVLVSGGLGDGSAPFSNEIIFYKFSK